MKVTVSQTQPPLARQPQIQALLGNPGIAAVLDARAAARIAATPALGGHETERPSPALARPVLPGLGLPAPSTAAEDPASAKLDAAFFSAIGLEPKSLKLLSGLEAQLPRESRISYRAALGDLEKAAQEAVGKSAFEAGVFVLGAPDQITKLTDNTLAITARLAAGGKLAAGGVKAAAPFIPALAPNASALRDALMLLTAPEALGKALDTTQPVFSRLTATGRLLATGAAVAAHFVPALSAHAAQISTIGWLCNVGDKTYAAVVER